MRGEPHRLLLVEVGVLERGESAEVRDEGCREADAIDVEAVPPHAVDARRRALSRRRPRRSPGWRARPRGDLLLHHRKADPENPSLSLCLARDQVGSHRGDAGKPSEKRPLVGVGPEGIIEEDGVADLPRLPLEGKGDEVPEAAPGHRVLVREEPVVGLHPKPGAARHRLGEEEAADLPGDRGEHRFLEEEPRVRAVARARAFDRGGESDGAARLREREDVVGPGALVEVDGEQVAALVAQEGIDADDVLPLQVVQEDARGDGLPGLVRAVATAHPGLLAERAVPLVEAGGRVTLGTLLRVGPCAWIDVSPAAEERGEKGDLRVGRRGRRRRARPRESDRDRRLRRGRSPKVGNPGLHSRPLGVELGEASFETGKLARACGWRRHRPERLPDGSGTRSAAARPMQT